MDIKDINLDKLNKDSDLVKVSYYINKHDSDYINEFCKRTGCSRSELVRLILGSFVRQQTDK